MTNATRRTAKFTATIFPAGSGGSLGMDTEGVPYTVLCSYNEGGNRTATDSDGTQFQPSLTIWYELTDDQPAPEIGTTCYAGIGDLTSYSSASAAGAKLIKSIAVQPYINATQKPDVEIACQ